MTDFKAAPNSISAAAPSQIPLGELQRSPDLLAGFGGRFAAGEGLGWGRGGKGEGKGREEEGNGGRGREGPQVTVEPARAPQSLSTPLVRHMQ